MRKILTILAILILLTTPVLAKVEYRVPMSGCTGSMKPIDCNSKIYAETDYYPPYKEGNIYCYRPNYQKWGMSYPNYICHRLINKTDNGKLIFKGDNNDYKDPAVEPKYVFLHVTEVIV